MSVLSPAPAVVQHLPKDPLATASARHWPCPPACHEVADEGDANAGQHRDQRAVREVGDHEEPGHDESSSEDKGPAGPGVKVSFLKQADSVQDHGDEGHHQSRELQPHIADNAYRGEVRLVGASPIRQVPHHADRQGDEQESSTHSREASTAMGQRPCSQECGSVDEEREAPQK